VTLTSNRADRAALKLITLEPTGASNENRTDPVPATRSTVNTEEASAIFWIDVWQVTDVSEVHELVRHAVKPNDAELVNALAPKFKPSTVSEDPPDAAVFRSTDDRTAASKLSAAPVPTTLETVTCATGSPSLTRDGDKQTADVAELHELVAQISECRTMVDVNELPKLRPATVTELDPLRT